MGNLADIIESYNISDGQVGVPLRSTIEVQFDRLIDEDSIRDSMFLEGPDYDAVLGPAHRVEEWPTSSSFEVSPDEVPDFLASAGYHGVADGTFTITHPGNKTNAVFTPTRILAASTDYTFHLTDVYSTSIGDTVDGVGNGGNGVVDFTGTWDGSADTVSVRITTSGVAGLAQFEWWLDSDPLTITGPILTSAAGRILLDTETYVHFQSGSFYENDEFSASLSVPTLFSGNLTLDFTTGSGSIEAMPSTSSTSVISYLYQQATSSLTPLSVVSTSPEDHDAQVDIDLSEITITFNKSIESTSVTDDVITIMTEVASSHPSLAAIARGELLKRLSVSGRTITITL